MNTVFCETENELRNKEITTDLFARQLSICKEHGEKDTGIGFGEFLLYEGKIDTYELENALCYQRVEHIALGVLAVQEKYLSERQLCNILDFQRERGGLFGEIAIELELLKDDSVKELLNMQESKHIRIGEVLVMFGAINREDMESYLQFFHASL